MFDNKCYEYNPIPTTCNKNAIDVPLRNGDIDSKYGRFTAEGSFDIFCKKNEKSLRQYIQCNSDVRLENDVFGESINLASRIEEIIKPKHILMVICKFQT